jgi:hypothetical protein
MFRSCRALVLLSEALIHYCPRGNIMPARALTALLGLAAALSLIAAPAQAADTSAPSLSVPGVSSFIVGQVTDDVFDVDGSLSFADGGAKRQYKWTASDPSGICRYSVDELYIEGWTNGVVDYATHATTGQYTYHASEFEHSGNLFSIRVNAFDCAGNKRSVERPIYGISLLKDYGPTVPSGWGRTSCTCAIGDSMLRTSTYKASLSTVVNGAGTNKHVALIMAKGPARGKASIYFDGVYVKTIDTYAATNINRVVMWDKALTGSANHTIKIVNQATAGRPRIDIDAYVQ